MHRHHPDRRDENGTALIFALMFTTLVLGIVLTGTLTVRTQISQNRTSFVANYQAVMTARSGLTEALSWLRRQTSQPVTAFAPQLDPAADPPILDTEEPDIGLVRDFNISGDLWARYEVWKVWAGDPDATRASWRQQVQCEDVSTLMSQSTAGQTWRLRSVGYVYRLEDPTVPFNEEPNKVLASELAETDVRRAVLTLPGQAAINVGDGNSAHINTNSRVNGNGLAGIFYPQGSGTPTTGPSNQNRVTGSPPLSPGTSYDDDYESVFGMSFEELASIADQVVTSQGDFPQPLPEGGIVIADIGSTLNFDNGFPLQGTAIVVVRGNCVLNPGNNSLFNGLLYVEGNLTVRAPCELNGSVVCTGNLTMQGSGDYATINYDEDALNSLMDVLGSYRRATSLSLPRRQ